MTGTGQRLEAGSRPLLVAATAANLAGWHDANLRALGHRSEWRDGWWLTPDDVPVIYFRAIAIRPGADPRVPVRSCHLAAFLAVCDPWSDLELGQHGMTFEADRPWMVRPPGRLAPVAAADDLSIERVDDPMALLDYERTAALGFGAPVQTPGAWHAPLLLRDGRSDLWLGRQAGAAVATANGFRDAGVLGIYSVATLPDARRRGTGSAMTAAAITASPDLPAVLQPSEMAEALYRRLGFERFTTFRTWTRSAR